MAKLSTYLAKLTKRVATLFLIIFVCFLSKNYPKLCQQLPKSTGELIFWLIFEFLPKKLEKLLIIAIFGAIFGQFLAISMVNTPQIGGNY